MADLTGFRPSSRLVGMVLPVILAATTTAATRGRADIGTTHNIATGRRTASNATTRSETSDRQEGTTAISFQSRADFLVVVEGAIGDLGRQNLLVDTGHHQTTIDSQVARTLGLTPTPAHLEAFGRRIAAGRVIVPWVKVGPLKSLDLPVLVTDLRQAGAPMGLRVDGIIGLDFLRGTCVSIDYRRRVLAIGRTEAWDFSIEFQPPGRYPILKSIIDGNSYRVLVDTGADIISLFDRSVAEHRIPFDGVARADHLGGAAVLRRFTADTVRLGAFELRRVAVFVAPGGMSLEYDGLIGARRLTSTRLQLDLERMVLSWDK